MVMRHVKFTIRTFRMPELHTTQGLMLSIWGF